MEKQPTIDASLCVGPTYGNDYDACPCDEPDCLVCIKRKLRYDIEQIFTRALPGNRDNSINGAASLAGFNLPTSCGLEVAMGIIKPFVEAMQNQPEGVDFWMERAKSCYFRAVSRRLIA